MTVGRIARDVCSSHPYICIFPFVPALIRVAFCLIIRRRRWCCDVTSEMSVCTFCWLWWVLPETEDNVLTAIKRLKAPLCTSANIWWWIRDTLKSGRRRFYCDEGWSVPFLLGMRSSVCETRVRAEVKYLSAILVIELVLTLSQSNDNLFFTTLFEHSTPL